MATRNIELEQIKAIKEAYPQINWDRFEDIDRSLNWELWHGPLPSNYWTEVEPLDHYEWKGYVQAEQDIREILDPLPQTLYFDADGGACVTEKNPEEDEYNWLFTCENCGELIRKDWNVDTEKEFWILHDDEESTCEHEPNYSQDGDWIGGDWYIIDPRKVLMYDESWKQVF